MARSLSLSPEHGRVLTLDDLEDFVREARAKGFPARQQVRFMAAIEVDFANGPRATRITAVPDEVSD